MNKIQLVFKTPDGRKHALKMGGKGKYVMLREVKHEPVRDIAANKGRDR